MEAGRELDALVAEKVMGWEYLEVGYFGEEDETPRQVELNDWLDKVGIESIGPYFIDVERDFWIYASDMWGHGWNPSTNIADAWRVVEKLCNWDVDDNMLVLEGQGPDIEEEGQPGWVAKQWWKADIVGIAGHNIGEADTAPHAICLAALKAVGVEID